MFEAMQGTKEKQQQSAAATTTQAGSFVFSQTSMRMPKNFDGGSAAEGVDIYYPNECLLWTTTLIRGGRVAHTNQGWATERRWDGFGSRVCRRVGRPGLSGLVDTYNTIVYKPLLLQIQSLRSPSEGWKIFKKFYGPQSAAEKARLT